ncbi:hypothetical protein V1512DRAFT_293526 [Lipomyces arxii]|uniref:uncharacterized protein n=1 Tax=Lipomyces arxii TaxID=56418 RepID=UPI0034CEC077
MNHRWEFQQANVPSVNMSAISDLPYQSRVYSEKTKANNARMLLSERSTPSMSATQEMHRVSTPVLTAALNSVPVFAPASELVGVPNSTSIEAPSYVPACSSSPVPVVVPTSAPVIAPANMSIPELTVVPTLPTVVSTPVSTVAPFETVFSTALPTFQSSAPPIVLPVTKADMALKTSGATEPSVVFSNATDGLVQCQVADDAAILQLMALVNDNSSTLYFAQTLPPTEPTAMPSSEPVLATLEAITTETNMIPATMVDQDISLVPENFRLDESKVIDQLLALSGYPTTASAEANAMPPSPVNHDINLKSENPHPDEDEIADQLLALSGWSDSASASQVEQTDNLSTNTRTNSSIVDLSSFAELAAASSVALAATNRRERRLDGQRRIAAARSRAALQEKKSRPGPPLTIFRAEGNDLAFTALGKHRVDALRDAVHDEFDSITQPGRLPLSPLSVNNQETSRELSVKKLKKTSTMAVATAVRVPTSPLAKPPVPPRVSPSTSPSVSPSELQATPPELAPRSALAAAQIVPAPTPDASEEVKPNMSKQSYPVNFTIATGERGKRRRLEAKTKPNELDEDKQEEIVRLSLKFMRMMFTRQDDAK